MPSILENSEIFTEIIMFTVEPEQQQKLVDAIIDEVERWVRHRPGFVSANFHKSLDGTRIVNYAQWTTKEAWQAFTQDPEAAVLRQKIQSVGKEIAGDGHPYKVYRSIEPAKT